VKARTHPRVIILQGGLTCDEANHVERHGGLPTVRTYEYPPNIVKSHRDARMALSYDD
jgi:hypothetical protein